MTHAINRQSGGRTAHPLCRLILLPSLNSYPATLYTHNEGFITEYGHGIALQHSNTPLRRGWASPTPPKVCTSFGVFSAFPHVFSRSNASSCGISTGIAFHSTQKVTLSPIAASAEMAVGFPPFLRFFSGKITPADRPHEGSPGEIYGLQPGALVLESGTHVYNFSARRPFDRALATGDRWHLGSPKRSLKWDGCRGYSRPLTKRRFVALWGRAARSCATVTVTLVTSVLLSAAHVRAQGRLLQSVEHRSPLSFLHTQPSKSHKQGPRGL